MKGISQSLCQALIQASMEGIHILDVEGNVIEVNDAFCKMLGYPREEVLRLNVADWDTQWPATQLRKRFKSMIGRSTQFETVHRCKDGKLLNVEVSACGIELDGKSFFYAASRDITARKRAAEELRIAAIAFETQDGIVITDAYGVILRANLAFTEMTGYTAEEAVGQTASLFKSDRHDAAFYKAMWESVQRSGAWQGEIWNRRKNGEVYPEWLSITAVKGDDGEITHYVAVKHDITRRKRAEEKIKTLAFYDTLTQLPNRRLLDDRLGQVMALSKRSGCYGAAMFLDLDNFKTLNDTHGHGAGDLLLIEAAQRLTHCVREVDTVARFGGDEFVVVLSELDRDKAESASRVSSIAEKIRAALSKPYVLKIQHEGEAETTIEHHCSASIGVVLFINHAISTEDILKWADTAMYQAKEAGRNQIRIYEPNA